MKCQNPQCESDDTKTARMVYLTSTTMTITKGTNTSLSLASSGATIGGGTNRSKSKAQLMLAVEEDIQPPKAPPSELVYLFSSIIFAAFVTLVLMAMAKLQNGSWFLYLFAPTCIILVPLFQWTAWGLWDNHRELIRLYNKKWICLRCGHTWYAND